MRTFRSALAVAIMAASIATPSLLSAQRNTRRTGARARVASPELSRAAETPAARADHGDYSLAVVSAVLPSETSDAKSDFVTLVIENRGTVDAPSSVISVAPRNHLTLARRSSIPALRPGERTTVQLPVEIAPDGTPCISITITSAPIPSPATAIFLASTAPAVAPEAAPEVAPVLPSATWASTDDWGYASPFGAVSFFGGLGSAGDLL